MKCIIATLLISIGLAQAAPAQILRTSQLPDDSLWESRLTIIFKVIDLPEEEKKEFMKLFGEYDEKLVAIDQKTIALIFDYMENRSYITEEKAGDFVDRFFKAKEEHLALSKKYYRIFKKKFGTTTAARFVQTMNFIQHHHDARYAGKIPLIE